MAQQVRTISSSAGLQTWTPSGAAGAAILAVDDEGYVESSATGNTASGTLALQSSFAIPSDAVINSLVVRAKVRLAAAGSRIIRCGFSGTQMADTQSLTSTSWTYMDFPFAMNPSTSSSWTPTAVNSLTTAYLRAYADADGPTVHADYLAIVVDYTSDDEPDPDPEDPISIPGVSTIMSGNIPVVKVMAGTTEIWPSPAAIVQFTVTGTSFAPQIELRSGSTSVTTWSSNSSTIGGTSLSPTITWADNGPHIVTLKVSRRADLTTINCGFDSTNDTGRYGPGTTYNYSPQPVTAITGLRQLTGLKRFLAANTTLSGELDFTGCKALEFIECFGSSTESVILDGCSSLIRLCVEGNNIPVLDLNPVRTTLRDLRAAAMQGGVLEILPVSGNLTSLYHFCVRGQEIIMMPLLSQMPAIEQWWVWGCAIASPGTPTSTVLNSCLAYNNSMPQSVVDELLVYIQGNVLASSGNVRLDGNAAPSSAGETAANALIARGGWSVTTELGSGGTEPEPPEEIDATIFTTALSKRTVFGHQSVGYQVLQGVTMLAGELGLSNPTYPDIESTSLPSTGGFLAHFYAGTNGNAYTKTAEFLSHLQSGLAAQVDIVVLKFCYADLRSGSGYTPAQMFAEYKAWVNAVESQFPHIAVIYATEAIVMGENSDGANNGLRQTFNNLVRAEYGASGRLWDVAGIQSTDPDGNKILYGGVESLYSGYASPDQRHIYGLGRTTVATPLLKIIAQI